MASQRYECKLSLELQEKAATEFNEPRDNLVRLEAIDQLRNSFLTKHKGYPIIRCDDEFILRFLRAKKFNQEKALLVMLNYHKSRQEYREIFDLVDDPSKMKSAIDLGCIYPLPGKDKMGRNVILYRSGLLDAAELDLHEIAALYVMTLERLLEDEEFQINGLNVIEDYRNLGIRLMAKLSMSVMRKLAYMTQDAMPIRLKAANIVNENKFFDILFAMFKPLIRKKLLARVFLHGSNYATLKEQINASFLPPYLGGTGPDADESGKAWVQELLEWEPKGKTLQCNI